MNTSYLIGLLLIVAVASQVGGCRSGNAIEADSETQEKKEVVKEVSVVKPSLENLGLTITESVTLAPEEEVTISSEVTATLTKWHVAENSVVKAGDPIVTLDPIDYRITLSQAKSGLAALVAQHVSVEKDYNRLKAILEQGGIPQSQFDAVKAQKIALENQIDASKENVKLLERKVAKAVIRAPFDGVITAKLAPLGKYVMANLPGGGNIAKIVKTDRLKASFSLSEMYYSELSEINEVSFFIPSLNKTVKAKVDSKGKTISALKTFSLISYIDNRDTSLPAGVFAIATIKTPEKSRIIVPPTSVKTTGNRIGQVFYVEQGKVKSQQVTIGFTFEQGLELIGDVPDSLIKDVSNVNEGESVVTIEG